MAEDFTPGQRNTLAELISNAVASALANNQQQNTQPGPQGPPGPPGPPGPAGAGGGGPQIKRFTAEDIGYFDPSLSLELGRGNIISIGKELYIRNVHIFVNRIRDAAAIHSEETIRINLSGCLRGSALSWYTGELNDLTREALRTLPTGMTRWIELLEERFKKPMLEAQTELISQKYTCNDALNRREPTEYVQTMVLAAQSAGLSTVHQQLTWAWFGIDDALRAFLNEPTDNTSVAEFINQMNGKKDSWAGLIRNRNGGQFRSFNYPQSFQRYPQQGYPSRGGFQGQPRYGYGPGVGYGNSGYGSAFPSFQNPFQSNPYYGPNSAAQNQQNTPNTQTGQQTNPYAGRLPPARPQLLLTANQTHAGYGNRPQSSSGFRNNNNTNRGRSNYRGNAQSRFQRPQRYQPQAAYNAGESSEPNADAAGSTDITNTPAAEQLDTPLPDEQYQPQEHFNDGYAEGFSDGAYYADDAGDDQEPLGLFAPYWHISPVEFQCNHCQKLFSSNNGLHRHLRTQNCKITAANGKDETSAWHSTVSDVEIVHSTAKLITSPDGLAFRNYHYCTALVRLTSNGPDESVCLDTGCTMTLIDRKFAQRLLPNLQLRQMPKAISVTGIGDDRHESAEYILLDLYFPAVVRGRSVLAHVSGEAHIVDNLRANALVGVDLLTPSSFTINLSKAEATIASCQDAAVKLRITPKDNRRVNRAVSVLQDTIVPANSSSLVQIKYKGVIPSGRDYLFEPIFPGAYAHLVDAQTRTVLFCNDSATEAVLKRHTRLGYIVENLAEGAYAVDAAESILAVDSYAASKDHPLPKVAIDGENIPGVSARKHPLGISIHGDNHTYHRISELVKRFPDLFVDTGRLINVSEEDHMRVDLVDNWQDFKWTPRVYPLSTRDEAAIDATFSKMHQHGKMTWTTDPTQFGFPCFVIWKGDPPKHRVVVDIRPLNKINVTDAYPMPLQEDILAAVAGCGYLTAVDCTDFFHSWPVRESDRHKLVVISHRGQETFNVAPMGFKNSPAHVQRQMDRRLRQYREFVRIFIDDLVIFSRTLEEHLKHLAIIFKLLDDLRVTLKPSKAFIAYPSIKLLGQVVDAFGMTAAEDKLHALLALDFPETLKKLELFIGLSTWLRNYCPYYAQIVEPLQSRKTMLLRSAPSGNARQHYTQATELIPTPREEEAFRIYQETLREHHRLAHFVATRRLYIDVDASKEFGVGVMVYHVKGDPAALDIRKDDIEPIMYLSKCLSQAERNYWPTELEVAGLVFALKKTRKMVQSSRMATIVFTDHGATTSIVKQTSLTTSSTDKLNLRLVRASQYCSQYNLDVYHKPGKEHIVPDALSRLRQRLVQRIDPAEDTLDDLPCYTYHTTLVEMKPELRQELIQSYVDNEVWHGLIMKFEKAMAAVPDRADAINRPETPNTPDTPEDPVQNSQDTITPDVGETSRPDAIDEVKTLDAKGTTPKAGETNRPDAIDEVKTLDTEGTTPRAGETNRLDAIDEEEGEDTEDGDNLSMAAIGPLPGVPFIYRDKLLYFVDPFDGRERLVFTKAFEKRLFHAAHDVANHLGFHRSYERLHAIYLKNMSRRLRLYIRHCPHCQAVQTKRHAPYGQLKPVVYPTLPFSTITIDFILALPKAEGFDFDAVMSVTCKCSKRIGAVPGRTDWNAAQWAHALCDMLESCSWGIPDTIISDRDRKFLSDLWKAIFQRMGTSLLYSTAYHPQSDGQSERTNQTLEIALRHLLVAEGSNWVKALPHIIALLNNSINSTIGRSPNEIIYGFKLNEAAVRPGPLEKMPKHSADEILTFEQERAIHRKEAAECVAFANAYAKIRYDARHIPLILTPGQDKAYLRLHHGYHVPGAGNAKLGVQRVGPFNVKRAIGANAYELELPARWKIHPVISVAYLEPAYGTDPFNRKSNAGDTEVVTTTGDTDEWKSFEIEKLLDRRIRLYGAARKPVVEYLVKWKNCGPEDNEWYGADLLDNAKELVDAYDTLHGPPNTDTPVGSRKRGRGRPRKST
jgi:hypothetical protein